MSARQQVALLRMAIDPNDEQRNEEARRNNMAVVSLLQRHRIPYDTCYFWESGVQPTLVIEADLLTGIDEIRARITDLIDYFANYAPSRPSRA